MFQGGNKITFLDKVGTDIPALCARKRSGSQIIMQMLQWDASIQASKQGDTRSAQPRVQGFYLKMENPLVVDMAGEPYDDREFTKTLKHRAKAGV